MKQDKFQEYDAKHPEVYQMLVDMARRVITRGYNKYGIKSLIEVVRWHRNVEQGDAMFKINNSFAPFYSRKIALDHPDLDIFEYRTAAADREIGRPEAQAPTE